MSEHLGFGQYIWEVIGRDKDPIWITDPHDSNKQILVPHPESEVIFHVKDENLIVRGGRVNSAQQIFGTAIGTPSNLGFLYMGVGSGTTAAAITDTTLTTELTGNANRFTLTNFSGSPLSSAALSQSTSGGFDQLVQVQAVMTTGDLNNGSSVSEGAIFTTNVFGTGLMFNHFVFSSISKTSAISLTLQLSLRL